MSIDSVLLLKEMHKQLYYYENVCHFVFASLLSYYKVKITFRANLYIDPKAWRRWHHGRGTAV